MGKPLKLCLQGYSPPGREKITQHVYDAEELAKRRAQAPDAKENFECGRDDHPVLTNIWLPDGVLPGFKEASLDAFWVNPPASFMFLKALTRFMQTFREAQLPILRALAIGFNLPEEYFVEFHQTAENQLRLLHYPRYVHVLCCLILS